MCGLDTQESILATKVSNLRNKSHLYSKMTTCVSNCPNFIATGVPIGLYGQTDRRTDGRPEKNNMSPNPSGGDIINNSKFTTKTGINLNGVMGKNVHLFFKMAHSFGKYGPFL